MFIGWNGHSIQNHVYLPSVGIDGDTPWWLFRDRFWYYATNGEELGYSTYQANVYASQHEYNVLHPWGYEPWDVWNNTTRLQWEENFEFYGAYFLGEPP